MKKILSALTLMSIGLVGILTVVPTVAKDRQHSGYNYYSNGINPTVVRRGGRDGRRGGHHRDRGHHDHHRSSDHHGQNHHRRGEHHGQNHHRSRDHHRGSHDNHRRGEHHRRHSSNSGSYQFFHF